jgi:signal transduction histidine kinase
MTFRRKLLVMVALTVVLTVAAVAWVVTFFARRAFERSDEQRTSALVQQFHRQFNQRADDVARRVTAGASGETATRMALDLSADPARAPSHLNEAAQVAESQRLDFLEFVDAAGKIISSAQTPAKFGYAETSIRNLAAVAKQPPFLKLEDLSDGPVLGLFAVRAVPAGDTPIYAVGGQRIDPGFLSTLELPPGMHAALYQGSSGDFAPAALMNPGANWTEPQKLAPLIALAQRERREFSLLTHWSADPSDDETITAIPLAGQEQTPLAVLLVSSSRQPYVELKRKIESVALLVGAAGTLLALLISGWAATRITRPLTQFADAAREVGSGNFAARVEIQSSDEIGALAEAFNRMTTELQEQRQRLVQTERVAAWRELARRLAHELKNPLFPLQLTVENLVRARQQRPELFEETFQESADTLLAEIANLKGIIARFSEFSKMPEPRFQNVDVNGLLRAVQRLFQSQFAPSPQATVRCELALDPDLQPIAADAELLHRAVSNLVLNAIDAMPNGGTLTLATHHNDDRVTIQISDTGSGLTQEECERLFTPYYTSKQHGTGLGLAIVQSVISDHGGKISVQSQPGHGAAFLIELPRNLDKLAAASPARTATS